MINKDNMLKWILASDPTFYPKLECAYIRCLDDLGSIFYSDAVGDLIGHVLELHKAGKTDKVDTIFEVIERWIKEGDESVKKYAINYFLEGIQNNSNSEDFVP